MGCHPYTVCGTYKRVYGDNDREIDKNNQPPTRPGITNEPFVSSYDAKRNILARAWRMPAPETWSRKDDNIAKLICMNKCEARASRQMVKVILQLDGKMSGQLNALLRSNGVKVKKQFR